MPVTEGIIVPITADAKGLTDGIDRAKKSIFSLKLEQEKYESLAFTEKNTLRLIEYNRRIQDLQGEIKQLTNKGKQGFDELGNAVQGSTNPLTKGFSLLRQIAYILPGIGIAGILGFATEPLFKYLGTLTGISEAAKLAKKEQDDFNKSLDHGVGSAMKTGFELKAYINIAADLSKSMQERNRALIEANKLYGEHNEKLSLTNIETQRVKEQVEGYTQALIDNAIAAKYGDKLADGYFKQREAARAYGIELAKLETAQKQLNTAALESNKDPMKGVRSGVGDLTLLNAQTAYQRQLSATQKTAEDYKKVTKELTVTSGDYVNVLTKANSELTKFGALEKEAKAPVVKAEKFVEQYHPKGPIYSVLGDAENGNAAKRLELLLKGVGVVATKVGLDVSEAVRKDTNEFNKATLAAREWEQSLQAVKDFVFNDLNQAFAQTFSNIGQGGKSAIQSIMADLGNLIKKLIAAALAAAALAAIMAAAGFGLTGAGGVVQNSFGGIFKTLFGGTTGLKLASGGITNGPTRALIGEGKEREVVTPLSQLRNIIGSVGGQRAMPVPQLYMRGADMWIMWQRQQLQNKRNY